MSRTHQQRDDYEDRFFEQQQRQFDRFETKLDSNTAVSQKALAKATEAAKQATLTNGRVTALEISVNTNLKEAHAVSRKALKRAYRVHERLVDMEKVLVPDKPPEPEDLPKWWKDPTVLKTVVYVTAAVILALLGWKGNLADILK